MAVSKILLLKTVFLKTIILLTTLNWVIGPLRNRTERNPAGSVEEVMLRINRRLGGIERAIQNQPSQEVLSNFRQELLTLELNYKRLRYIVYATYYRRRLETIVRLSTTIDNLLAPQPHQQITAEHAGRGNMGTSATAALGQSSSNSILSSDSTNSRRVAKKRFSIDKGKLNHLLSCRFTVRAIAREGLLGERLHYNTVHNIMTRNGMASVRERYI